jgi:hypothetical protein
MMNLDAVRGLSQPDQRTCGPSSLVAARMLVDPMYSATMNPHAFASEVLSLHRQVTSVSGSRIPWPRALGTPPWAVARAMSTYAGVPYSTTVVPFHDRKKLVGRMQAAVAAGHPVPFYIGSRWLPRHVVLAVADLPDGVTVYNPAHGTLVPMSASDFEAAKLTTLGSWTKPWFVILPDKS